MRYSQIRKMDIVNGPGIRISLFTQGCPFHCKDCFNKETWDFDGGFEWTSEKEKLLLDLCNRPQIKGLSILGGEPLINQNLETLKILFTKFRELYPDKNIWMWTGNIYENLTPEQKEVANMVDVLVDGPWILRLGDFKLKYKGSSNQRVIDIKKTKESGKVELLDI